MGNILGPIIVGITAVEKIVELLKEINDLGTTIVIATHDYEIIKKFNSRIIKCANKKIEEITIAEL